MLILPDAIVSLLSPFAPMFQARTWTKAQVLLVGAVLATHKRTVTSALRVMGLSDEPGFARYHHVLNRAVWSPLQPSRVLLLLLVEHPGQGDGPRVFGIDETLERRRGKRIKARGVYRDAVRSSRSHLVKASGLRWISLMWLSTIPWAHRTWALPVLTVLAPSERYCRQMGRTHKKITDWARQMIVQLRRRLPNRPLVVVADSSYAALDLLHFCQSMTRPVTFITRLRLDAALYEPRSTPTVRDRWGVHASRANVCPRSVNSLNVPTETGPRCPWAGTTAPSARWRSSLKQRVWHHAGRPPVPIRWVLIQDPLRQFDSQALLCTDPAVSPGQIIEWFVLRWQIEVTFQETRAHLGVETQRQWSDLAISRTTPVLLGLFSWITLAAHLLGDRRLATPRSAAWYVKSAPTFVDAIALVRRHLWSASETFCTSSQKPDMRKVPTHLYNRFIESLAYAA